MISVYLKPTNFCNVGCAHCYLTEEVRANKFKMTQQVLEQSAKTLLEMQKKQRAERVHIIWHGGEPLVLSASYFEQAGQTLDELLPGHSESLQTSLIPLKQDHLPWIKKRLGGYVGSSMDFTARVTKDGPEGYQRLWMSKVELCRAFDVNVIPGVTPSKLEMSNAKVINQWMVDREFERFNIERYNSFGFNAPMHPSNKEHSDFLWEMFVDLMHRFLEGSATPMVRVIGAVIGGVMYGTPGDRWGGSCQRDFIVIEPNGDLNNCPDKSSKEPAYSNVADGFDGFANSALRRKWIRIQSIGHQNSYCATCENSSWCKTGCPLTCNDTSKEQECSGYKSFITRARNWIEESALNQSAAVAYWERFIGASSSSGNDGKQVYQDLY